MKGIILDMLVPTGNSVYNHKHKFEFKEVSDNFDLNTFISRLKKTSDKSSIVCLYYFDVEKDIFEKYDKSLNKETSKRENIIIDIREILEQNYKIDLFPENNKNEIQLTIDKKLTEALGEYYTEDDFNFHYNSDNTLKSLNIYLDENLVNWEHSTETDEYQQYGEEAWDDDDFMEPNFDDFSNLREKIEKALKGLSYIKGFKLDYSEKNTLILTIVFK